MNRLTINSTRILMGIALVFSLAVAVLTYLLYSALSEEAKAIKAADQHILRMAGNELFKLQKTALLFSSGHANREDLQLYYDILYSRAQIFMTRRIHSSFHHQDEELARFSHEILALDQIIGEIESPSSPAFDTLYKRLDRMEKQWFDLYLTAFQYSMDKSTTEKQRQLTLAAVLGLGLVFLIASVSCLLVILFGQMKLRQAALEREYALNAQLVATTKAVENASMAKTSFLQTMSHELRTPLNAISGFSELLQTTALEEKQANYLRSISQSSHKLTVLIQDILDYVEIEADVFNCKPEKIETTVFMDNLHSQVDSQMEEQKKNLDVAFVTDKDVPPSFVNDPMQLNRVLVHLCDNAIKFTEQGKNITVRLKTVGTEGDSWLRFEVKDEGIGISAQYRPHIFEAFSQADQSLTRRFEGTGLGLAICKKTVKMLEGRIGVESREGEGSLFWVEIPVECPCSLT